MFEISEDEALNSYYSRNLFFSGYPNFKGENYYSFFDNAKWTVEKLLSFMRKASAERMVSVNRLIFNHTTHHKHSFIYSYSYKDSCCLSKRDSAARLTDCVGSKLIKFCPECVKDDLEIKGYVYWRRTHQDTVTVCWRHNMKLKNSCGLCGKEYMHTFNYFAGAWELCSCGGTVLDLKFEKNWNISELKVAVFLAEFYSYDYRVSYFDLNRVISDRINNLSLHCDESVYQYLAEEIGENYSGGAISPAQNQAPSDFIIRNIKYLAFLFPSFSDFAIALLEKKVFRQRIDYDPTIEEVANSLKLHDRTKLSRRLIKTDE